MTTTIIEMTTPADISKKPDKPLLTLKQGDMGLVSGVENELGCTVMKPLTENQKTKFEYSLDGVSAIGLPRPQSIEEENRLIQSFLRGLKKLLSKEDNWTFL